MLDNKFKSAAAKLLAQHSGKPQPKPAAKPPSPAPAAQQPARNEPPKQSLDFIWERKPEEQSGNAPYEYNAVAATEYNSSPSSISAKMPVILTAAIGCGLMLNITPFPAIGFIGNAFVGLAVGVFAGMAISRYL